MPTKTAKNLDGLANERPFARPAEKDTCPPYIVCEGEGGTGRGNPSIVRRRKSQRVGRYSYRVPLSARPTAVAADW